MKVRRVAALASVCCAMGLVLAWAGIAQANSNANTAGPPTTVHNVQPTYTGGNITTCPSGTTAFINTSNSVPGNQSVSYSKNGTTFAATVDSTGTYISFTTNSPSFTVYVKGGPAYDTYDYTGTAMHPVYPSDSGLHSPYNNGGNIAVISHYLVCGQPASVVPQGSCEGSGSISAYVSGSNVTAYVPKGTWEGGGPGIDVVNVEGSSITNTTIPTGTDIINSIATNSVTGQSVAVANNNDVYVLKGTGLDPSVPSQPLHDAGTGSIGFTGGSATTTGVTMDATNNKAVIALSVGGVGGFQFLDLATDTFEPAFTTEDSNHAISEDPLIDPIHHVLLSAAEDNNYEIMNVSTSTSPQFFEHPVSVGGGPELDSSAEDCSTGIILAPAEFSDPSVVEVADISKPGTAPNAVFTPGSPGSWTAPEQVQTLTGSSLSAGPSGSAVAQGTHTGVLAGEFGGDGLTALALPTTSGSGATPAISNWVTCETGSDPSGNPFQMGDDPHTLAAYQSPNGGDAIALLANEGASELVRVDLTDMLNPTMVPATGNVCNSGTLPAGAESFIPLP